MTRLNHSMTSVTYTPSPVDFWNQEHTSGPVLGLHYSPHPFFIYFFINIYDDKDDAGLTLMSNQKHQHVTVTQNYTIFVILFIVSQPTHLRGLHTERACTHVSHTPMWAVNVPPTWCCLYRYSIVTLQKSIFSYRKQFYILSWKSAKYINNVLCRVTPSQHV